MYKMREIMIVYTIWNICLTYWMIWVESFRTAVLQNAFYYALAIISYGLYFSLLSFAIIQFINGKNMNKGFAKLKQGMSEKKVVSLLGEPDSVGIREDNTLTYHWFNDEGILKSFILFGIRKKEIRAVFRNGLLIEFEGKYIKIPQNKSTE